MHIRITLAGTDEELATFRDLPAPPADPGRGPCADCGKPIPSSRNRNALYCTKVCGWAAAYRRRR